jgi:glutamine synthetase
MAVADDPKLEQVKEIARTRGIEFFFAQFVDLYGRPSAKLVPAASLDDLVREGAGFAGFAAGEIGQQPSDPDVAAMPDVASLTLVPWQPNLARFACDVTVEGEPWPYCPRTILRRQLERARELGYEFKLGLELEYFLVRRSDDGSLVIAAAADTLE